MLLEKSEQCDLSTKSLAGLCSAFSRVTKYQPLSGFFEVHHSNKEDVTAYTSNSSNKAMMKTINGHSVRISLCESLRQSTDASSWKADAGFSPHRACFCLSLRLLSCWERWGTGCDVLKHVADLASVHLPRKVAEPSLFAASRDSRRPVVKDSEADIHEGPRHQSS